jgi:hypothetical protein
VVLVMRQGLTLAAAGVVIGLALALAGGRVVSWLLFGVTPTDRVCSSGFRSCSRRWRLWLLTFRHAER